VRRGEVNNRCDVHFFNPIFVNARHDLLSSKLDIISLADLTKKPGQIQNFGAYSLCNFITFVDSGIPYIKVENYNEHGINWDSIQYITPDIHDLLVKSKVRYGDILLSMAGTIGIATVFDKHLEANSNQAIAKIRLNDDRITPAFLADFLNCRLGYLQSLRISNGGVQLNINLGEIGTILVPLPSLDMQHTLVADMESARTARRAKLGQADELLKGIDGFVLEQLGLKLPKSDDRSVFSIKLGDTKKRLDAYSNHPRFRNLKDVLLNKLSAVELSTLAIEIFSGITPTAGGDAYIEDASGIPFVRSGEITPDGKVAENIELLLKPEIHDGMMKRSQLKQGDLLIAIVGATIGSVGVYDRNTPANINQAIAGVRLNDKVLPEFICWYLKSSAGQAVLEFLKRPVARANINLEEVGQILVPVPEIGIQKKIITEVEKRRVQARTLREAAEGEWQSAKEKFEKALLR